MTRRQTRQRRSASPLERDAASADKHACVCRPLRRIRSVKPRRGRDDSISNQISPHLVLLKVRPRVVISEMDAETAESGEDGETCLQLDLGDTGSYVFYSWTVFFFFFLKQFLNSAAAGACRHPAVWGGGSKLAHWFKNDGPQKSRVNIFAAGATSAGGWWTCWSDASLQRSQWCRWVSGGCTNTVWWRCLRCTKIWQNSARYCSVLVMRYVVLTYLIPEVRARICVYWCRTHCHGNGAVCHVTALHAFMHDFVNSHQLFLLVGKFRVLYVIWYGIIGTHWSPTAVCVCMWWLSEP